MADGYLWPTWRLALAWFSGNSEMLGKVKIVTNRSPMTNESLGLTRRNGVRTFESWKWRPTIAGYSGFNEAQCLRQLLRSHILECSHLSNGISRRCPTLLRIRSLLHKTAGCAHFIYYKELRLEAHIHYPSSSLLISRTPSFLTITDPNST